MKPNPSRSSASPAASPATPVSPARNRRTRRTRTATAFALPTLLLGVAGCGAKVEAAPERPSVTLENCGEKITYERPQRAIAYDMSALEKVFALGLQKQLRGMVLPKTVADPAKRSAFAKDYAATENLSTNVLSLETVVNSKADFVLAGWKSGFSEERGITPKRLSDLGIAAYQFTESCFEYGNKPVKTDPLPSLYTDLTQLGEIFGVQSRADELVSDIKTRFAALEKRRPSGAGPTVFIYDSGTAAPYTSGSQGMPHVIVEKAGAKHAFAGVNKRWTEVGWEAVAQSKPDVIAVVDYGDQPVAEKIAFLKSHPALSGTEAVRQDRFFVLDYGMAVSGPRNIDAAEKLADYLEAKGL